MSSHNADNRTLVNITMPSEVWHAAAKGKLNPPAAQTNCQPNPAVHTNNNTLASNPDAAQRSQGDSSRVAVNQQHNENKNRRGPQRIGNFKGSRKEFLALLQHGQFNQKGDKNENTGEDAGEGEGVGQEIHNFIIDPDNDT